MGGCLFSSRLKAIRKKRGLTQKEVSERAGISQKAVSKYERGEMQPAVDKLYQLAKVLKIPPEILLSDEPIENLRPFEIKPPRRKRQKTQSPP